MLNYPANPTAVVADLDFYREVVAFAKKHDLIVLSDLAYAEIYFEGEPPPSILQVPGAIDIAVEFTTLSKTYAMPGWRVGFAVGNERLIACADAGEVLSRLWRLHPDPGGGRRGAQRPAGLRRRDPRASTSERRDCLVDASRAPAGRSRAPPATMFAWAPIPELFAHLGSLEFSKLLLEKAGVAVSPGVGFGEYGEGYVRLALVENGHRIRQAARNIRRSCSGTTTNRQAAPAPSFRRLSGMPSDAADGHGRGWAPSVQGVSRLHRPRTAGFCSGRSRPGADLAYRLGPRAAGERGLDPVLLRCRDAREALARKIPSGRRRRADRRQWAGWQRSSPWRSRQRQASRYR